MRILKFVASLSEVTVALETHRLMAGVWMKSSLIEDSTLNLWSLAQVFVVGPEDLALIFSMLNYEQFL